MTLHHVPNLSHTAQLTPLHTSSHILSLTTVKALLILTTHNSISSLLTLHSTQVYTNIRGGPCPVSHSYRPTTTSQLSLGAQHVLVSTLFSFTLQALQSLALLFSIPVTRLLVSHVSLRNLLWAFWLSLVQHSVTLPHTPQLFTMFDTISF